MATENLTQDELLDAAYSQFKALQRRESNLNDKLDALDKEKQPVRENLLAITNNQPLPYPDVLTAYLNRPKRGRAAAKDKESAPAKG